MDDEGAGVSSSASAAMHKDQVCSVVSWLDVRFAVDRFRFHSLVNLVQDSIRIIHSILYLLGAQPERDGMEKKARSLPFVFLDKALNGIPLCGRQVGGVAVYAWG